MCEVFWMAIILGFGILIGGSMVGIRMDTPELNSAQSLCSTNQGVDFIVTRAIQQNSVFCKNGVKYYILEAAK